MMGNEVVGGIVAVIIAVAVVVTASRKRQGSDGSDDSVEVQLTLSLRFYLTGTHRPCVLRSSSIIG